MESFGSNSITELYCKLCEAVYDYGWTVGNTKERENMIAILYDPMSRLIQEPERKHKLDYLKKELLWYLSGSLSASWIGQHAKIWLQIADEQGNVNSNYGYTIFHKLFSGQTQFEHVVQELQRDENSRRAIMFFQEPNRHYYQMHTTKDYPCTCAAQFLLRQGELNMTIFMRSNDLVYGWCNDLPFFSFVCELVAAKLGAKMGRVTLHSGSLHIYERHFKIASAAVSSKYADWKPSSEAAFPKIKRDEVDKILKLEKCSYVDFLTGSGEVNIHGLK